MQKLSLVDSDSNLQKDKTKNGISFIDKPEKVVVIPHIEKVICGSCDCYVIIEEGNLYATGENKCGQFGVGDRVGRNIRMFF
jgi:alpha-tubulin suppressor-like RCC1 family protein